MTSRQCKQADLAMAALSAGRLDDAERIRLQEHLESCRACSARAQGIAPLVDLLRTSATEAKPERLERVWQRVLADTASRPAPQRPSRGLWLTWAPPVGAAAAIVGTLALVWVLSERSAPQPDSAPAGAQEQLSWQSIAVSGTRVNGRMLSAGTRVAMGDQVSVGAGGRALFASGSSVLIVDPNTKLAIARSGPQTTLRLRHGRVILGSRDADSRSPKPVIQIDDITVRPIGTTFAVARPDRPSSPPDVIVIEGRVEVSDPQHRVVVEKDSGLTWGERPRALQRRKRRRVAQTLRRAKRLAKAAARPSRRVQVRGPADKPIVIDGFVLGTGSGSWVAQAGSHELALAHGQQLRRRHALEIAASGGASDDQTDLQVDLRSAGLLEPLAEPGVPPSEPPSTTTVRKMTRKDRHTQARHKPPRSVPSAARPAVTSADVQRVQRLLGDGQPAEARSAARRLLGQTPEPGLTRRLLTLVAESQVRQSRYRQARDAYLHVVRRFPQTTAGAHALYMTGSIELDQLRDARSAQRRFARYLQNFTSGPQRQGAYYLQWRAARRLGDGPRAQKIALQYLAEFPHGQYASALTSTAR